MRNNILAKEKKLINNNDDSLYKKLSLRYKYILEYYLNTVVDFKKYENEIDNSNLYIGKNSRYKSLNEYLNLDYIFLINNLFIEKLSDDNLELLKNSFNKDNLSIELVEMVKNTYQDVIRDNYLNGEYYDKIYNVCYGEFVPTNFVSNNSLVFKIYYGKNLKELFKEDFIKLHQDQLKFFRKIISEIKNEIMVKLNVQCEILLEKDIYE